MQSIKYGGWSFTHPTPLGPDLLPTEPAIYAIQVPNSHWGPLPFEPIYFGESCDLADRGVDAWHHALLRWGLHPRGKNGLYVSFLALPFMGKQLRQRLEARLMEQYRRSCVWSEEEQFPRWLPRRQQMAAPPSPPEQMT